VEARSIWESGSDRPGRSSWKPPREHRVPLKAAADAVSPMACEWRPARILDRHGGIVPRRGRAGRPLSNMAPSMLPRRMGRGEMSLSCECFGRRSGIGQGSAPASRAISPMLLVISSVYKVSGLHRRGDGLRAAQAAPDDRGMRACGVAPAGDRRDRALRQAGAAMTDRLSLTNAPPTLPSKIEGPPGHVQLFRRLRVRKPSGSMLSCLVERLGWGGFFIVIAVPPISYWRITHEVSSANWSCHRALVSSGQ
jgi:hypothetical protein